MKGYKDKSVILVLGMHRSATSLTSKLLSEMGVYLGKKEQMMEATKDNQDGYYERNDVMELHDNILLENDMLWTSFREKPLLSLHTKNVKQINAILIELCDDASSDLIGIKDPRMCILEQFWHREFLNIGLRERVVIVFRHPYEVAKSLEKRDGMNFYYALKLWYYYNNSILNTILDLKHDDILFVNHNEYFLHPELQIQKIISFLNLELGYAKYLESIHRDLRHNYAEAVEKNELYEIVLLLYHYLVKLEKNEVDLCREDVENFNRYWKKIFAISYDSKKMDMPNKAYQLKMWCLFQLSEKKSFLTSKFQKFFSENHIHEIFIYGDGTVAEGLYCILDSVEIIVTYVFDETPRRNEIQIGKQIVPVVSFDSKYISQSSFIINTVINHAEEISELFYKKSKNQNVILLSDILYDFILGE